MSDFVPWNSQPLDDWAKEFAEGDFIDLSGRRTHFVERGQGEPVLLIHGFNLDWHTWTRQGTWRILTVQRSGIDS